VKIIKAKFEVITPMFLGESTLGGDTVACAEAIRGASVKGALRAHFRALSWSRIRRTLPTDDAALKQLHAEEANIFGSAVMNGKGGQANFLLRSKGERIKPQENMAGNNEALQYLLGMGLFHFKDGLLRRHIPAGTTFELEFLLKPTLSAEQVQQLKATILAFGFLGGLGSRARKGFGSVTITSLMVNNHVEPLPTTIQEYKTAIRQLIGTKLVNGLPPLTAYSAATRLQISAHGKEALSLLTKHGLEMGLYRSYGRGGWAFKQQAEQNFKADHDWAYDLEKRRADESYLPQRAVFGLPHPYYLSGTHFSVAVEPETGRRASPLMAHVHKLPDGNCLLVHSIMRSVYLPESIKVNVKTSKQSYQLQAIDNHIDWGKLDTFLARFSPKTEDVIYG